MMRNIFYLLFFICLVPCGATAQFVVEKLPALINSPYDEIIPVPSRDGNTLFFTRVGHPDFNHTLILDTVDWAKKLKPEPYRNFLAAVYSEIAGYKVVDPERSPFNQDVWMARGDSAIFTQIIHPGPPLNNALPNSIAAITPDPNALYCLNQFKPTGDMGKGFSVIRQTSDSTWSFPEPIEIDEYYTITSPVNLTMSFDGKVLILSAVRYDSRDMDLYVCFRKGERHWTAPKHLGNTVNSEKREATPFLSEDHTTLFFSSNRPEALGGSDLFISKRLDDTWLNWSKPIRMVEPINSRQDESQPYFNMSSGYLYFTSRRDGGNSDIFRVRLAPPQPTELLVKGRVVNRKTNETVGNATISYGAKGEPGNTLLAENGFFDLKIPKGVTFELTPEKPAFAGETTEVLYRRDYYYFREQYVDVFLDLLEVNAKIDLRPIFFAQSKAEILEESFPELTRLAVTLQGSPGLHIRIEGHTDNNGRPEDLLRLSQERADAVKGWLVEKGIAEQRIATKGFGSAQPLGDNSSEEQRSKNRRVEFRITKI